MRLRQVVTTMLAMAAMFAGPKPAHSQQTAEEIYQAGLYQEEVQGDLEQAISIFERILREFPQNRAVAAQAQLHIGLCYEALGRNEAQRAYELVIRDYADQPDVVARARARLGALAPVPLGGRGPVARLIFTSLNPADEVIENPGGIIPSPDGRHVALTERHALWIRDLVTGGLERVTPEGEDLDYWWPVFSADGGRVAVQESDTRTKVAVIRILDLSSRTSRVIPGLDARALRPVDWSRDGRYLLCNNDQETTLELVTVADGSTATLSDSVWSAQRASFSPDGRYVAYGAGPHTHETLYVQPLAGGPRQAIAKAGGWMYLHPLWSPDGSAIAYQEDDGIWVQPMQEGAPSGPARLAYRPDAARWVAAWTEAGGLYFTTVKEARHPLEVEVDPRTAQSVGILPGELEGYPELLSFRWSRDRSAVAANIWVGFKVYAPEAGTTKAFVNLEPEGVMINGGVWSPDGREIWYQTNTLTPPADAGVKGLDVSTGEVRQVFPPLPGRAGKVTLSADGGTWAFLRTEADRSVSVVVAPAGRVEGRVLVKLNLPGQEPISTSAPPQISPTGEQLFYVLQRPVQGDRPEADAGSIWVVDVEGSAPRKVATAPVIQTALWDPTGRFVAFTATNLDGNTALRVVEVATGAVHETPSETTDSWLLLNDWSSDGRYIGFVQVKRWWEYWAVQGLLDGAQ